jgi:hypothetical protein
LPVENYHINICRQKKETKSFKLPDLLGWQSFELY